MKVQELSGVELARKVAAAVGWEIWPKQSGYESRITVPGGVVRRNPAESADDALEALRVMNGRGWIATWDQGNNELHLHKDVGYKIITAKGNGQTFAKALSRAIVVAYESGKGQ